MYLVTGFTVETPKIERHFSSGFIFDVPALTVFDLHFLFT